MTDLRKRMEVENGSVDRLSWEEWVSKINKVQEST